MILPTIDGVPSQQDQQSIISELYAIGKGHRKVGFRLDCEMRKTEVYHTVKKMTFQHRISDYLSPVVK